MSPGNSETLPKATLRFTPRRVVLLLILLALVVGLGWALRDFVRDSIVIPLLSLFWVFWILLQSVPQLVYWALFLLVALVAAWRSLAANQKIDISAERTRVTGRLTLSRFAYWQRGLESMNGNTFSRERILRELQQLVLQVLAEHDRIALDEIRGRLLRGELDYSAEAPAIQALLEPAVRRTRFAELLPQPRGLRAWLSRLFRRPPAPVFEHTIDVPVIVAWLERETGKIEPDNRGDALGTEYR